jgi:ribonucleoside-diphosphate reductase alpha chain
MEKFDWLTDDARTFLSRGYLPPGKRAEERYWDIAVSVEEISDISGVADKIYDYFSRNLISLSSPIISNFGTDRGLPISCNMGIVSDTLHSITYSEYEMAMLAQAGAGTAKHMSNIRAYGTPYGPDKSGRSEGLISWVSSYAAKIAKINQGGVRRGFFTAWASVTHPEIMEFLDIGAIGDAKKSAGFAIQNITAGVTIPAGWIESMRNGDAEKRQIYAKILKRRSEIAFPYILFEDNCNDVKPQVYKDKDMPLLTSNICTEIILRRRKRICLLPLVVECCSF